MSNKSGTAEQVISDRPTLSNQRQETSTADGSGQERASASGPLPTVSLPKGGGAIQGMGEKFSMNPVTGSGSMSIPIAVSPGRSGFSPQLALGYDSGAGNTLFGLGWDLSIPAITRKTAKGLPRYRDEEASDIFLISGAEDLVPTLIQEGAVWEKDAFPQGQYFVRRYRPRTEGLFARIEKWEDRTTGEVHWKSITPDNITSIFGRSTASRLADPEDPARIFSWLLEESFDDKGNAIQYEYKPENAANIDPSLPQEGPRLRRNKSFANRYIKRIRYGNQNPGERADWHFEVVFDYGEHQDGSADSIPSYAEQRPWPVRQDPFSTFRSGFEIRTYRLCRRVLMFHRFAELGAEPCLVASTNFRYVEQPHLSKLVAVTHTGYLKREAPGAYTQKTMPPVEFGYSEPQIDDQIREIDPESLENLPVGLDGGFYQWVDLDGEGLSGVLAQRNDAWYYKRNLGNAQFAPQERLAVQPSLSNTGSSSPQIMDLDGDGLMELVLLDESVPGYFEKNAEIEDPDHAWQPFRPFQSLPNVDWGDPNLRMIDLNGDGHADILLTEDRLFRWYPSKETEGFGPSEYVPKAADEENGPTLVFADSTLSVFLADMSGDGLTDIVRLRNGEVCYWPNLGYGRFGERILMDRSPWFDFQEQFDPRRLRLTDIDGSGTIDIIYLGHSMIQLWYNQAGNGWSEPQELTGFPPVDNLSSVNVIDLLGNGTACLVWSSPLPEDADRPMRYIDLMGGQKPHLLIASTNNLGSETRLQYAASTKFYLQDQANGTPWITKLPFPVHVLERVETYDSISGNRFASRYAYHHGYFDGGEREFRGFGMVEQWDTEDFETFRANTPNPEIPSNWSAETDIPPVYTKTWFHTGAHRVHDKISQHYLREYYQGDPDAILLSDTELPEGLNTEEEREACRALRGAMLRQEVYALDNTEKSAHPYSVVESKSHIKLVQPRVENAHAVFYVCNCETLTYHYERNPADPRMAHSHTLELDPKYFMPLKTAAVVYPRRGAGHAPEQMERHIVLSESTVTHLDQSNAFYRIGLPVESRSCEITGLAPMGAIFMKSELRAAIDGALEIPYEATPAADTVQKRLLERSRIQYLKNDLSGGLPFGEAESLALPYKTYTLAFSKEHLDSIFGDRAAITDTMLRKDGKYEQLEEEGLWWIASGTVEFDAGRFYLPVKATDPFGHSSTVEYDPYALLPVRAKDALENVIESRNDYRVLGPVEVTDPNGNRSEVRHDALGMLVGTAVMGKAAPAPVEGDNFDNFEANLTPQQIRNFFDAADPRPLALALLGTASARTLYDMESLPARAATIARETHVRDLAQGEEPKIQLSFAYSDGFGRAIMAKVQAEPGEAPLRDEQGNLQKDEAGNLILGTVQERWIGNGRTVFNNKGKPVKQYEPFFSSTHSYEQEAELVEQGVTPILHYDPLGRNIRTELPNGTFSKVEFDPWQQTSYDPNDTILDSRWYAERMSPDNSNVAERRAAELSAKHANTPAIVQLDTLGRPFLSIAHNKKGDGTDEFIYTRTYLDMEGNPLCILNDLGNKVMKYGKEIESKFITAYTIGGLLLYQNSMDAGERWMLNDVAGKPIHGYDSKQHHTFSQYDALQRPTGVYLELEDQADAVFLIQKTIYGEEQPADRNLRGQVYQHYDSSGLITSVQFDFKGNLLEAQRQLAAAFDAEIIDWTAGSPTNRLDAETFTSITEYDALSRMTRLYNWHRSAERVGIYEPAYNERGALVAEDHITAAQRTAGGYTGGRRVTAARDIEYDAKGQRLKMRYGNGTTTRYHYDPLTFRLLQLKTTRNGTNGSMPSAPSNLSDPNVLQNLYYTYDPVGNITEILDDAYEPVFFRNQQVEPRSRYTYDALYRLIQAEGRENNTFDAPPGPREPNPVSGNFPKTDRTLRNYTQRYEYDTVGNIMQMRHIANGERWTRHYEYATDSNRLRRTWRGNDEINAVTYGHDIHGNMLNYNNTPEAYLPHWDYADRMYHIDLGGGGEARYQYDAGRQRSRKRIIRQEGTVEERLYLGGLELYRRWNGAALVEEIETQHLFLDNQRVLMVEDVLQTDNNNLDTGILDRYQYSNHLGSVGLELDSNTAIISYEEYHPYGTVAYQAVNAVIKATGKRYRYTGMERDEETGLNYHGARYYLGWLGRWGSADPIGITDGINIYLYSRNSPLKFRDERGTDTDTYCAPVEYSTRVESSHTVCLSFEERLKMYKDVIENIPVNYHGRRSDAVNRWPLYMTKEEYYNLPIETWRWLRDIEDFHASRQIQPKNIPWETKHIGESHGIPISARTSEEYEKQKFSIGLSNVYDQSVAMPFQMVLPGTIAPRATAVVGALVSGSDVGQAFSGKSLSGKDLTVLERVSKGIWGGIGMLSIGLAKYTETVSSRSIPGLTLAEGTEYSVTIPEGSGIMQRIPPNQSTVPLPNPGEHISFGYGTRVHQELGRVIQETFPNASGQLRVRPGLTGEDFRGPINMNAKYGEMKSIWESGSKHASQARRWGYDIEDGIYFFYDRHTGIVFVGKYTDPLL